MELILCCLCIATYLCCELMALEDDQGGGRTYSTKQGPLFMERGEEGGGGY